MAARDPVTKTRWIDLLDAPQAMEGGSRHDLEKAELRERRELWDKHIEVLPTQVEDRDEPDRSSQSSEPLLVREDEVDPQGGQEGPHGGNYSLLKATQAELQNAKETVEEFQEQIAIMKDEILAVRQQNELDSQHRMRQQSLRLRSSSGYSTPRGQRVRSSSSKRSSTSKRERATMSGRRFPVQ